MGEARRRKSTEPYYGRVPKRGRGLVVCPPMEIQGSTVKIRSSNLDPQELRFALMFWDRLVWPTSGAVSLGSSSDELYLEQVGTLTRPEYTFMGDAAQGLAQTQIQAFLDLESKEPGCWALAQGENSLLLKDLILEKGRGALIELHRAIPVPSHDVPLAEILEFKSKRHDELVALRSEIDTLFSTVAASGDKEFEMTRTIESIDRACSDVLRVGKEWGYPMRMSDLKTSIDIKPFASVGGLWSGWEIGKLFGLPEVGALLGIVASSIKISSDFGAAKLKLHTNPYRYVYSFHEALR